MSVNLKTRSNNINSKRLLFDFSYGKAFLVSMISQLAKRTRYFYGTLFLRRNVFEIEQTVGPRLFLST